MEYIITDQTEQGECEFSPGFQVLWISTSLSRRVFRNTLDFTGPQIIQLAGVSPSRLQKFEWPVQEEIWTDQLESSSLNQPIMDQIEMSQSD